MRSGATKTAVIASDNPVKIDAALNSLRRMFPGQEFSGRIAVVPSGVSAQPTSDQETLRGALNRAEGAVRVVPEAEFWMGLEAGCELIGESWHLFAWAVVISRDNRVSRARMATVPLPAEIGDLVAQGVELGIASDRIFQRCDSKRGSGAVGILTGGVIDRTAYFEHAVIMALIPFANPNLSFR